MASVAAARNSVKALFEHMLAKSNGPYRDPDGTSKDDEKEKDSLLPRCHLTEINRVQARLCHGRNHKEEAVGVGYAKVRVRRAPKNE